MKVTMKCEKCGLGAVSQVFNRYGDATSFWETRGEAGPLIRGVTYPDEKKRYIVWKCGHPLCLKPGCGHHWLEVVMVTETKVTK